MPQRFRLQQAFSQQLGCSQQPASAPQAASQLGCSQQLWLQHDLQANRPFSRLNRHNRLRQQLLQAFSQQLVCSQQAGSALQAGSQQACSAQQVGSAWQQVASQHLVSQQPHPRPNMRLRRVAPKLWLQRPMLTTSAPTIMFHFIEQRLLCMELGVARVTFTNKATLSDTARSSLREGLLRPWLVPPLAVDRFGCVVGLFVSWTAWVETHSSQGYGPRSVEPFLGPKSRVGSLVLPLRAVAGTYSSLRDTYRIGCPAKGP